MSFCPYPGCEENLNGGGLFCPSCFREYWVCDKCHKANRVTALYCRRCCHRHEISAGWPEEGFDSRRSHCPALNGNSDRWSRKWVVKLSDHQDAPPGLGPAPIQVANLIIHYNVHTESFEARAIRDHGKLVWTCP